MVWGFQKCDFLENHFEKAPIYVETHSVEADEQTMVAESTSLSMTPLKRVEMTALCGSFYRKCQKLRNPGNLLFTTHQIFCETFKDCHEITIHQLC